MPKYFYVKEGIIMFLVDIRDLLFGAFIVAFPISMFYVLLKDRHIAPRERFEWDKKSKYYRYVEGSRFCYIGDPTNWFPARKRVSYRIQEISIECVLTTYKNYPYDTNLLNLYATLGLELHSMCLSVYEAKKTYPEQNGKSDPIEKIEQKIEQMLKSFYSVG